MGTPHNCRIGDVSIASSGDNTVVAAVAGRSIIIWTIDLENEDATTDVNVIFKHGTTAFNATAATVSANGGGWWRADYSDTAPFRCLPGEAFIINLSGALSVTGQVKYQLL